MNTVPSGLGLSGNNRNFGPDQSIGQCGLTHIWAPHNGHETTFKCCISHDEPFCCFCSLIALIANAAAACSAARRLRPWAWVLMASLLIAQLTVNVWLCAAPSVRSEERRVGKECVAGRAGEGCRKKRENIA